VRGSRLEAEADQGARQLRLRPLQGPRSRVQVDRREETSMTTTKIAGLDHVVAWDDSEQRHVYLDGADLVFKDNEVVHVGPGYAGPVDTTISGKGFMAIPGLVNVRSHPFSEPANKGLTE